MAAQHARKRDLRLHRALPRPPDRAHARRGRRTASGGARVRLGWRLALVALLLASCARSPEEFSQVKPGGLRAEAHASGDAMMTAGQRPYVMTGAKAVTGTIDIVTVDEGDRWSALQNIDEVDVKAEVRTGGDTYTIRSTQAMPHHPTSAYTTWFGVAYDHAQHGDTRIGTPDLPRMEPAVSLWAWAQVMKNGTVVGKNVPLHVMVNTKDPMQGVMMDVAGEDRSLLAAPDGYLIVHWAQIASVSLPTAEHQRREILGYVVLLALVLLFGWLALGEPARVISRP